MQKKQLATTLTTAIAFALLGGCATTNTSDTSGLNSELDSRTAALDSRESALNKRESNLGSSSAPAAYTTAGDLLPPNAKSGECYARVWVPAEYRTVSEQRIAKEASERIEVIPATYGWGTETVEVSSASSKLVTTPATYGSASEEILISDELVEWKQSLGKNAAPASSELLALAKKYGADLDSATPGMCFHEHYRPAQYTTEDEQVLVSEASESINVIPATYRNTERTIVVSEASSKIVEVPATYKTVTEKILVKPAHTVWKKGTGPIQRIDSSTGEIMCLVEVPAEYKTISKRVVDTPASTRTIDIPSQSKTITVREQATAAAENRTAIPAKYKTVSKRVKMADASLTWHDIHNTEEPKTTRTGQQVCLTKKPAVYKTVTRRVVKTPASTHEVVIPAVTKTVKVQKLVSAASEKRIPIPETYKTVTRKELVKEGYMQWRSILCQTNITPSRISQIQSALKAKGYNPGAIDGVIGAQTIQAVNAFQKANNLPVDKYLNIETVRALDVTPR